MCNMVNGFEQYEIALGKERVWVNHISVDVSSSLTLMSAGFQKPHVITPLHSKRQTERIDILFSRVTAWRREDLSDVHGAGL